MKRHPLPILLAALFALTIAGFATWRVFYGVDFSDEAFYVAMPYTFALGNEPFVNELALQQTAGILLIPFTKAYVALRGAEGIVLAFRFLFLGLAALTGAAIFRLARVVSGITAALLLSVVPFAIVPGILSVSYNTIGMNFLLAGTCLAAHGVLRASRISLLLAGPALIVSAFAYPTLLVPGTLCAVIAAVWLARERRKEEWRTFVYGWLAAALLAFLYMASLGWDNLATSALYMLRHARHGGDSSKLETLWTALRKSAPYDSWKLWLLAVAGLATISFRKWQWLGITVMIVLLASFRDANTWRVVASVTIYAALFLAPVVAITAWKRSGAHIALLVMLPGLAAALITAWTSSNGFPNAMIGASTALAGALILAQTSAEEHGAVVVPLVTAFFLATIASSIYNYVYLDAPLPNLTSRVESGPYAGLHTTPERRAFVERIAADVERHAKGKKALFYDTFPAGYLFNDTPPRIEGTWIPFAIAFPGFDRTWYTSYYALPENRPDVVFELLTVPGSSSYARPKWDDPMRHNFWRSGYHIATENVHYAIYGRCPSCTTDVLEAESLLGDEEAPTWRLLPGPYSDGAIAATSRRGAVLQGTIPRFRPGPYRVDFSHYRNAPRTNELRITLGDDVRRVVVGKKAPHRLSRVIGVIFPDVRAPNFSIEVESGGKSALLLDQIAFTRAPDAASLDAQCSYCQIGPLGRRPVTFEPESVVKPDHANLEERRRVVTEWIRIQRPAYSGGGAVMTSATGATLRGRILNLQSGDYEVTVSVIHPAPNYDAKFRLTLGGATRVLQTDPSLPRGSHAVKAVFQGVRGDQLSLASVDPGKPSLMIDSVVLNHK